MNEQEKTISLPVSMRIVVEDGQAEVVSTEYRDFTEDEIGAFFLREMRKAKERDHERYSGI